MLKWLLKSLLILIALVVASATLPFASVWLCRDPVGGQVFFWVAPWTCAVWTLLAAQLVGSRFWRGAEAVREWRARKGGHLHTVASGTCWMFFGLFASYAAEFALLWLFGTPALLPLAAYSPALFAALWCSR